MKAIELLKMGQILLKTMHESCIKVKDVHFVEMYEEYVELLKKKHKMSYIATTLSQKYKISERQFFYIIKRLSQDCNFSAA